MDVILFPLLRTMLHFFSKSNLIAAVMFLQIKKILDRFCSRSLAPFCLASNFKLNGD